MEIFDHLTDKTKRFLILMNEEDNHLEDLRAQLKRERETRDRLLEKREQLITTISELEERRDTFDDKVTNLIDALGDIPLGELSES